jgi:16S rRNA (adenine(1408)-N(1))-methyltransferase
LSEYAYRASRKPSRGGLANVLYVLGSVEEPPEELMRAADEVHVIFPWAALLRGLLRPDERILGGLVSLGKPGAAFELTLTYDAAHDHSAGLDADIPSLSPAYVEDVLSQPYRQAGFVIEDCRLLPSQDALAVPSTWGRRLLHGRPRDVVLITGTISPGEG